MKEQQKINPLGSAPVSKLMVKFAVPSIIAMLVSALYNIVDQLFIGQAVGTLGNAATNIAFLLSTSCVSLALLFGIGGASCFNLTLGKGEREKAPYYVGNAVVCLFGSGLVLCVIAQIFLTQLLRGFGSPDDVLPYAQTYVRITSIGFPFLILTTGGGHLIRADGSPRMTMICNLSGAVINTILDAVFVFGFHMGMAGAAYATIIGQIFSGFLVINYLRRYKTVPLLGKHFKIRWAYVRETMKIGTASFINQIAMMIVQIVLNNSLAYYGALSSYGEAIPLACAGIVMKVNQVFFSVVIGLAQGSQPIESFNYGAKQYCRVREAYRLAAAAGACISVFSFAVFQIFPRQVISLFGSGSESYYEFGISYFRVFLFFTCLNWLQPITSTFFTSIGKPGKGTFLSLTRQILFLLPLLNGLPLLIGIDGILYAGPIADFLAAMVT
ncbi:MAG: MATE family efflux transporter, partial [Lachnospiraceae bacterium]|nr:MATE family efflux transporter [Lachnospiraceae bacterium]